MTTHPAFDIEYALVARVLKFLEPGRYLQFRVEDCGDGTWALRGFEHATWIDREGRRAPLTADEREAVRHRLVARARELGVWLHTGPHDASPRPADLPPPRPVRAVPPLPVAAEPADDSPADGEDVAIAREAEAAAVGETEAAIAACDDPELRAFLEFERDSQRVPSAKLRLSDPAALLREIEQALAQTEPMAAAGWEQAESIVRQLHWCRGAVRGEAVEAAPGPLSMGLIATREFDMYGSDPALAALINRIQDAVQRAG